MNKILKSKYSLKSSEKLKRSALKAFFTNKNVFLQGTDYRVHL